MAIQCPYCKSEEAYHNGVCYECPDCDATWSDGNDEDE